MSPSSCEEHRQVGDQVDAGDPAQAAEQRHRAPAERADAEAGGLQERLERAALEERVEPARGVEELERVARRRRVEHEQVELVLLVELVELGDRGELLRARDRGRQLAVDAVGLDLLGPRRDRARSARSARRTSAWGRASSPTARPRPRSAVASRAGSTRRGSFSSCSSPSALASRLAGSIVTTATLAPRAAIPSAIAADVVVLPTPPEPRADAHALAVEHLGDVHSAASSAPGELLELGQPEMIGEHVRKLDEAAVDVVAEAVALLALGRRRGRARTAPL